MATKKTSKASSKKSATKSRAATKDLKPKKDVKGGASLGKKWWDMKTNTGG